MKINKLLHSYLFNKNSISKDQQPVYPVEGMHVATKLAGKRCLGGLRSRQRKLPILPSPTCNDLQDSALCNLSVQVLNLALTAGAKHISHLKDS